MVALEIDLSQLQGGHEKSSLHADQVKSLHWRARRAVRKGRVNEAVLQEVRAKICALIGA